MILTVGHNAKTSFKTINDALDKCKMNDEIHIYTGKYNESFFINKEIIIKGIGNVVVESDNINYQDTCFISESSTIENITLKAKKGSALHLYACTDVIIRNCDFYSNEGICVTLGGSFDFIFNNCNIYSVDTAIYYNNMFKSSGKIIKSKLKSRDKYAIKSDKNGILDITESTLISEKNNCICLVDEAIINAKQCKFEKPENLDIIHVINSFASNLKIL